ncbi:MAG: hypothetical protein KC777_21150 [Cyanobacteria bacterium HKST-UBA02]|nr:hypothetical protein [Cyanobacteria bacterium HKST-UBA02]
MANADVRQVDVPSAKHGKRVKVSYDIQSLHRDGQKSLSNGGEVVWAFLKSPAQRQSGINSGHRDQYVAGLSHLYANNINQRLGNCYYIQRQELFEKGFYGQVPVKAGESARLNGFRGFEVGDNPLIAATIDGIAFLEESLSGKPNMIVGKIWSEDASFENERVFSAASGADIDRAWADNGQIPMIVAVNANTRMFTGVPTSEMRKQLRTTSVPFGGHVVVISQQRKGLKGKTSSSEYLLLNSWGDDQDGSARNGWVSSDALASAMNFVDGTGTNDESLEPKRRGLQSGTLPYPGKNIFARGENGLFFKRDTSMLQCRHVGQADDGRINPDADYDSRRGIGNPEKEASHLIETISKTDEGFSKNDIEIAKKAIEQILENKTRDGAKRPYALSVEEQAGVFHQANRLMQKSKRAYKQGLDREDRNRSLIAMLHDTANPEHINQGAHNTCNVTTIIKIESMFRPAAQAKAFVDMYINANGDQTVTMPI